MSSRTIVFQARGYSLWSRRFTGSTKSVRISSQERQAPERRARRPRIAMRRFLLMSRPGIFSQEARRIQGGGGLEDGGSLRGAAPGVSGIEAEGDLLDHSAPDGRASAARRLEADGRQGTGRRAVEILAAR